MASSSSSHNRSFSDFQRETPTVSRKVFDAFINHRGPDVKATLAFALYDSLEEKGCCAFLDDMELELGDSITSAIHDAIYSSRVQIAIFSPRYAESSWCLDELLLMLETKALFILIFCDVQPFELRYLRKGCYAAAFADHEENGRYNFDKIDQWKSALRFRADKSGYMFSTSNGHVEMLCATIVSAVQKEVRTRNSTERLHLFSCVCEMLRHLIATITHRPGLHADVAVAASTNTSAVHLRRSSVLSRDSHPVGIDSKVEDIKGLLQDPQIPVIAVVGMRGSGKTFLLQNVYKDIKAEYDHSIWLSIPQSYSLKILQNDIASHIDSNTERVSEERAAEMIQKRLKGKRCLIVLDDLWEISTEHSLIDKLGLPAHTDCKIVITTRDRRVALNSGAQIYEMKNLLEEDSWRLFCVYAFPNIVGNTAPQHLQVEAKNIVKQCGNLPLAIKTIAASLANSTLPSKWELKRRQLEKVVTPIGDPDHLAVMKILKLSYDSLPAHLKPCFAYLSFFSEDEEIDAEYLIYLWIGEGFIPAGEDQWDVAWDWLDQLAQLCLLQLYEAPKFFGLHKYCKIHDLLHDLAVQISKKDKCVFSVQEVFSHTSGATGWHRILLAKKNLDDSVMSEIRPVYLRTLSLSHNWEIRSIPENLFAAMRGLRVLDLRNTVISTLPTSVGKMILLKVLNLRGTEIEVVPECVRHLKSLFFLSLPQINSELPEWISELECLQHLEWEYGRRMPKGISKLRYLRTLRLRTQRTLRWLRLSIEEDGFTRLDNLVKMTQLQEVSFYLGHEIELKRTEEGILAQLVNMRHLEIYNLVRELGRFPEKMRAMKHLEYLWLRGFVVPGWICEFKNLRELYLRGSEMQRMPKEFGNSGGFPVLRILEILSFHSLEEFPEVEEGAMASLQRFKIWCCPKLKKAEGLERLKMVQVFDFSGCDGLSESIREGGDYWNKIKSANPNVVINHRIGLRVY